MVSETMALKATEEAILKTQMTAVTTAQKMMEFRGMAERVVT